MSVTPNHDEVSTARHRFCTQCGTASAAGASFCVNCGAKLLEDVQSEGAERVPLPLLSPEELLAGKASVDPRILAKLNTAKHTGSTHCLLCGYDGLMPVVGTWRPWYLRWYVIVLLFLTGVGIVLFIAIVILMATETKYFYICPNCEHRLVSK
jgi:hypothetical protein